SRADLTLLNNSEMAAEGPSDLPVLDLRTIEELCQPSLNGRGAIQATHFTLKNYMIQQSIKGNGVTDDALRLYLFPHSLTRHATAWFDCLPNNSINTFEQMAKMFLEKYFPPSMVTKLINEITNFRQRTFMKRLLEECYDLIENMTAHHNDWDTSTQRSELPSSITYSFDTVIAALKAKMAEINKNLVRVLQPPLARLKTFMLREPIKGNNQGRKEFFQGANQGQNQPPAYQAPAYQAPVYQAPVHQPQIPQPQVVTTNEFTNFMKANDAILKNMQTNMTSLTNSNLELKNMFSQFMKVNTASSLGSETLSGNTITNQKEDLKGITTQKGTAYPGPTIPTTSSSLVVERETEATKDTMHPTKNESIEDVQPSVVPTESLILNSEPVNSLIIHPVASPVSASKPNQRPLILIHPDCKIRSSVTKLTTNERIFFKSSRKPYPFSSSSTIPKLRFNFTYSASLGHDPDDDDDEDYTIAITPILSTKEPDNSLSMGDEHLDTIPATESDEFIKFSVENLVPIPSESEGNPENMCDVPFHDNSLPLDVSKDKFEDFFDSNNDSTSIDDDSFSINNIKYVEASPPDFELVSLEVMEIVILEVGGIDDDILLTIKDDILHEKLLNINLLIANIKELKDNPTPSSDFMTKSSSTSLNSLLEETNTFDNSLPKSKTFCFDFEEISSGSTTNRFDISLSDYEAFYDDHVKEISSGSTTTHSYYSLYDSFIFNLSINPFPPADRSDFYEFVDELAHIISPPEYDCFGFKNEPNSGDLTMDVVEDTFPTREPRVHIHNALPTHPTL
nr:hypothetical protein [Tanacetum cinerariifolium]